ncbi:mevalonate kinase [Bacillus sp. B1-b2]|uniref:mevalonate kinase n=1 Tax=Bacillus sp. B1-b2 TaxID=2653201 RepID=UPI001262178B|nr:mevalonate kinase [Bacillus sp. B1-b2]KAB7667728.1 mevalonate kinase [Bacillus sp. B1-b2]
MLETPQKIAVGRAHSKLILIGEHSVVYGQPAIAFPFKQTEVKVIVGEMEGNIIELESPFYVGPLHQIPEKMEGIGDCIIQTLKVLQQPSSGLNIQITSTIPIGRGLGSSAAIAIALVRGLFAYFHQKLSNSQLMTLVERAEKFAHGTPSGIDMVTASSANPIWFQKQQEVENVEIGAPFHLVVADSGRIGDTYAAVKSIRDKYEVQPELIEKSITQLGKLTKEVRVSLAEGDFHTVGSQLNQAQQLLSLLGVSDEVLDHLVEVAVSAGAVAAKLTGGGRGGCIIALVETEKLGEKVAEALIQAGAAQTWQYTIEKC